MGIFSKSYENMFDGKGKVRPKRHLMADKDRVRLLPPKSAFLANGQLRRGSFDSGDDVGEEPSGKMSLSGTTMFFS